MDANLLEAAVKSHLSEMHTHLEQAAGIAKAAETCADAGNVRKAIEIALDVEQILYEVSTFLNAASLMNRLYQT
jgi:hypothetical protein